MGEAASILILIGGVLSGFIFARMYYSSPNKLLELNKKVIASIKWDDDIINDNKIKNKESLKLLKDGFNELIK